MFCGYYCSPGVLGLDRNRNQANAIRGVLWHQAANTQIWEAEDSVGS